MRPFIVAGLAFGQISAISQDPPKNCHSYHDTHQIQAEWTNDTTSLPLPVSYWDSPQDGATDNQDSGLFKSLGYWMTSGALIVEMGKNKLKKALSDCNDKKESESWEWDSTFNGNFNSSEMTPDQAFRERVDEIVSVIDESQANALKKHSYLCVKTSAFQDDFKEFYFKDFDHDTYFTEDSEGNEFVNPDLRNRFEVVQNSECFNPAELKLMRLTGVKDIDTYITNPYDTEEYKRKFEISETEQRIDAISKLDAEIQEYLDKISVQDREIKAFQEQQEEKNVILGKHLQGSLKTLDSNGTQMDMFSMLSDPAAMTGVAKLNETEEPWTQVDKKAADTHLLYYAHVTNVINKTEAESKCAELHPHAKLAEIRSDIEISGLADYLNQIPGGYAWPKFFVDAGYQVKDGEKGYYWESFDASNSKAYISQKLPIHYVSERRSCITVNYKCKGKLSKCLENDQDVEHTLKFKSSKCDRTTAGKKRQELKYSAHKRFAIRAVCELRYAE